MLETLKQHYKKLAGVASIDALFLISLTAAYIYKGDICYQQWIDIFRRETYTSIGIVLLLEFVLIVLMTATFKKKGLPYIS
jgi:hypothetical protein